jgi:DNA-directed RNA polymerase specialized sigma24 family protein
MTLFVSSTVQAIHDDMVLYGCAPWVADDVCAAMDKQPVRYQIIFLDRMEGYNLDEISRDVHVRIDSVSRIIHKKLGCIASLLGP